MGKFQIGKHWKIKDTSKMGHTSWLKGKHLSEGTKKKLSEALKGHEISEKTKRKMSEIKKGKKPYKMTDEIRKKMSKAKKGRIPWNKGKPYKRLEKHWNWKGGKSFEPYSLDWTETLRRSIRERDNYICQLCSQYGNTIHHIDYNKLNCNPENLITLCVGCNIKVNKDRNYWIKYFSDRLEQIL